MLWMSVAAFSQITQEDYDKLPNETRTQIEKITTEKAIKGEIKEVSEYANLGKEIGVAVNETLAQSIHKQGNLFVKSVPDIKKIEKLQEGPSIMKQLIVCK